MPSGTCHSCGRKWGACKLAAWVEESVLTVAERHESSTIVLTQERLVEVLNMAGITVPKDATFTVEGIPYDPGWELDNSSSHGVHLLGKWNKVTKLEGGE